MKAEVEFKAPYALFTDPINRVGGEKMTYLVPTYAAVKGALGNLYLKPSFFWVVDAIRIMNPMRTESRSITLPHYAGGQADMATYLYLKDVRYQVKAHTEWNTNLPYYRNDWNEKKHERILREAIERGGRLPITMGPSECPAEVCACVYGEGPGFYDGFNMDLGVMEHCVLHNTEGYDEMTRTNPITVHFWHAVMNKGEIVFPRPDQCTIRKPLIRAFGKEGA